jgi:hypothetical protein
MRESTPQPTLPPTLAVAGDSSTAVTPTLSPRPFLRSAAFAGAALFPRAAGLFFLEIKAYAQPLKRGHFILDHRQQ